MQIVSRALGPYLTGTRFAFHASVFSLVLCLSIFTPAAHAQIQGSCGTEDRDCIVNLMRQSPVKTIAFWQKAMATPLAERIGNAPSELVQFLQLDVMANKYPNQPHESKMDPKFLADVRDAIAEIPPEVLAKLAPKLAGVYFIDDIGGTGFTDMVYDVYAQPVAAFTIIDPSVLAKYTANEWASWKENTPFKQDGRTHLSARIEAAKASNRKNAIQYILLHEFGHVLSVNSALDPSWSTPPKDIGATDKYTFFPLSWKVVDGKYATLFDDAFSQRKDVVFYFGAKLPASAMVATYTNLEKTNLATLYAATNPFDDFAESFVNYVHVVLLKRPFEITLSDDTHMLKTYSACWDSERCAAKRKIIETLLQTP